MTCLPAATISVGVRGLGLRPWGDSDRGLIFGYWLRSFARSEFAKSMVEPIYMASQHRLIERVLERGSCLILHPEGDPATGLGWIAYEPGVLHFVYVKGRLRRHGLGRILLDAAGMLGPEGITYTHRTHLGEVLVKAGVFAKAIYNPMRAYAED